MVDRVFTPGSPIEPRPTTDVFGAGPLLVPALLPSQVQQLQAKMAGGGGQPPDGPVSRLGRRIQKAGFNLFAFTDHTALVASGAESAAYTLSTVSGFNGIAASDTADGAALPSKTGSPSMVKLVCNGTQAGAANFFITSAASLNLPTGDDKFGMWVYFSTDITANSTWIQPTLTVGVSTANSFNGDSLDYTFSFNGNQIRQGWNFLVFRCDTSTVPYGMNKQGIGSVPFATGKLNRFRIYFQVPAGQKLTCYFDTLWSNFATKPAVSITFDISGDAAFQANALPALSTYGFKGVVFALPNGGSNDNTLNRLVDYNGTLGSVSSQLVCMNALYAAGWDISNHTLNHTNTSNDGAARTQLLTDAQLQYQIKACTAWQLAHGYKLGEEFYAAPQGRWDSVTIKRLLDWGYKMLRMGQQGINRTRTVYGYDQPGNMGWYGLDSIPTGQLGTYNQWVADIQTLLDYGGDVILGAHSIIPDVGPVDGATACPSATTMYVTQLKMLCAWLKAKQDAGLIVAGVTFTELYYDLVC